MKKFLAILILLLFVVQPLIISGKEIIFRQSWIELNKKVRTYDYSLKKRTGFLETGKYRLISSTNRYYQVGDSTYIKTDDDIKTFRVVYKPDSYITVEDTIEQHRKNVNQMLKETAQLTPSNYIFAAIVLGLLLISLIKE